MFSLQRLLTTNQEVMGQLNWLPFALLALANVQQLKMFSSCLLKSLGYVCICVYTLFVSLNLRIY